MPHRDARRAGRAGPDRRRASSSGRRPRCPSRCGAASPPALGPARGAHPRDRARRGRRLRRQGARLSRGDAGARGGAAPRRGRSSGSRRAASTSSPPRRIATRSTRRGSALGARRRASSPSRPRSPAITARFPTLGEAITLNTINHLPGPYRVPNYRGVGRNVVTHKTFAAAYRGAGRPEAAFVLDRLLDRAARRLGIDPAELRRRNLIRARRDAVPHRASPTATARRSPTTRPTTRRPSSGCSRALDYAGWRAEQAKRRGSGAADRHRALRLRRGHRHRALRGRRRPRRSRTAPSSSTSASAPRARATRRRSPRSAPTSWRCRSSRVVVGAATPSLVGYGMGTIASRVAAVAGPRWRAPPREVARQGAAGRPPSCSSARPRTSCSPTGRVLVTGVPGKSADASAEVARAAVRSRALAQAGGPGLSACGFFYPDTRHLGLRRPGRRRRGGRRDVRAPAAPLRRRARLRAPHQPDDRRGPAPRRRRPGHRHRARRGAGLRRRRASSSPAPSWTTRCRAPTRCRRFEVGHLDFPVRDQRARHQGRGRERRHRARRGHRQRGRGRARRLRRRDRPSPVTGARIFEMLRARGRWPRRT